MVYRGLKEVMSERFFIMLWDKVPGHWKQKLEKKVRSNLQSQYAESEEQLQRRTEVFLLKQGKILLAEGIIGVLLVCLFILYQFFSPDYILLDRNSFGQGRKEVQLSLKKENKREKITYKLEERRLTSEERRKIYKRFFNKLKKEMAGSNPSLRKVSTALNLPENIDGYPFEIVYEFPEDGYIHLDGTLNEEMQLKLKDGEKYNTYITVTARYRDYKDSRKYGISIIPRKSSSKTGLFYEVKKYLKAEEKKTPYENYVKVPSSYKKVKIQEKQDGGTVPGIAVLFTMICLFIPVHNYLKIREEAEKCQKEAERDFPVIVHLLTLYMGAGLSFFSAVKRIGHSYRQQKESNYVQGKYAFEKILLMEQHMNNGMSQKEACQIWGTQFKTDMYQKLSLILIQSFTKGSREAAMLMEMEEREAFRKRVDRAKKEGEEASTRLLFPMILLLGQVMLLVMYPALMRFQGF